MTATKGSLSPGEAVSKLEHVAVVGATNDRAADAIRVQGGEVLILRPDAESTEARDEDPTLRTPPAYGPAPKPATVKVSWLPQRWPVYGHRTPKGR